MNYRDLREWLDLVEREGELKKVDGARWDLEIGAISQLCEVKNTGKKEFALLFDDVPGFPPGHRVLTNYINSLWRFALTVELPIGLRRQDYVKAWLEKYSVIPRIEPRYVKDGPIMENICRDDKVNLLEFPTPKWYEGDGGRYIGTGAVTISVDPDENWVNLGVYRVMLLDRDKVIVYISPGRHGYIHRQKWFAKGRSFPMAISIGHDPLLYVVGSVEQPYGVSEYEVAGGIKGEPLEVIKGPVTGLPIPARGEIVIEGECLVDDTSIEGPFGEWSGYYASTAREEPIMRVKAVYYRNRPIILGFSGLRAPKGTPLEGQIIRSALLKRQMENAGIPDVTGVWFHKEGGPYMLTAVSIKQRYPGHARQAGHLASSCRTGAYCGAYVIVVDDDVDVTDLTHVMWAVATRTDPENAIDLIRKAWSTPLDPRISPENRAKRVFNNSRAVIDACRPYEWREQFPAVVDVSKNLEKATLARWSSVILG